MRRYKAGHEFDGENEGGENDYVADVFPQVVNIDQQSRGNEENGEEKVLERKHFAENPVAVIGAADEKPGGERSQLYAQSQQAGEHGDARSRWRTPSG